MSSGIHMLHDQASMFILSGKLNYGIVQNDFIVPEAESAVRNPDGMLLPPTMHVIMVRAKMSQGDNPENGNQAGIDVEFAREAFHRMGYKPVFVNIDWENKKNLVEQGKIDCIWACFSVTGRENDYHWAGPYMLSRQVIAVNDSSKINKLSDLKNKIIAVQSTTKPEELFLKQTDPKIPKVKQVYSMENRELIYTSLSRGYVDAIAAHEISIRQYMSDFEAKYRILDEDILETGIGVAFAKNDKRGIEKELSKTLKAMVKDGSAKKILQKYVPDAEKYLEVNSLER